MAPELLEALPPTLTLLSPTNPRLSQLQGNLNSSPRSSQTSQLSGSPRLSQLSPTSPGRSSLAPPPSSVSTRQLSRALTGQGKRGAGRQDLDRPDPSALAQRSLALQNGANAIVHKEDALEAIMSAESQQGFLQMKMYTLNKADVTRVAVDPVDLPSADKLDFMVDDTDLEPQSHHCLDLDLDSSFTDRHGLEMWSCSSKEFNSGATAPPEWLLESGALRIGVGFPFEESWPTGPDGREVPCQDRVFAARCGDFTLVGLANGHGKPRTSEALLQSVAELLPPMLFQSAAFLRDDVASALISAFHNVHCETAKELDLNLAGASVTVVVIDAHHAWVAHVGDCRAVLGVPDPQMNAEAFHFSPNCLTTDHTLAVKREFDRVRDAGAECRKLVEDHVYRLYVQDHELPGLTLTRALGDRVAHAVGVHHIPSVSMFERASSVGSFLAMGTGALWSVMSERIAVNWIGRHFADAPAAAASLADEAMKRWQEPACLAKQSLKGALREHFGSVVVYFEPPEAASCILRSFVLGPQSAKESQRQWSEVKQRGRTDELRRVQARLLHSEELTN